MLRWSTPSRWIRHFRPAQKFLLLFHRWTSTPAALTRSFGKLFSGSLLCTLVRKIRALWWFVFIPCTFLHSSPAITIIFTTSSSSSPSLPARQSAHSLTSLTTFTTFTSSLLSLCLPGLPHTPSWALQSTSNLALIIQRWSASRPTPTSIVSKTMSRISTIICPWSKQTPPSTAPWSNYNQKSNGTWDHISWTSLSRSTNPSDYTHRLCS